MSELESNLEYIAANCVAVKITEIIDYQIRCELDSNGRQFTSHGKTIAIAAFEMMDAIRNELSD